MLKNLFDRRILKIFHPSHFVFGMIRKIFRNIRKTSTTAGATSCPRL